MARTMCPLSHRLHANRDRRASGCLAARLSAAPYWERGTMIGWQNPAAFWALSLAALPIVIHLLRMHRADRVPFPSLRFVQTSRTAAVRFRLPSDWLLLIVRVAAVAFAVAAIAGP